MRSIRLAFLLVLFVLPCASIGSAEPASPEKIFVKEFSGPKPRWAQYLSSALRGKLRELKYTVVDTLPADITVEGGFTEKESEESFFEPMMYLDHAVFTAKDAQGSIIVQGEVTQKSETAMQEDEFYWAIDTGRQIALQIDLKMHRNSLK